MATRRPRDDGGDENRSTRMRFDANQTETMQQSESQRERQQRRGNEQVDEREEREERSSMFTAPTISSDTLPQRFCGHIESLDLINFMCHRSLHIEMGPRINFITGPNGSGKSAILAALTIGFGARAAATNRGSSLRDFANNPSQPWVIQIKICNRGMNAYEHARYGDSIIIERKSGVTSNTLSLKSITGKVISNRKEDLDNLKDHLNIQVDNPCAIMNQDTSRDFLKTKTKSDRYVFYMKAMQLDQIEQDLESTQHNVEMAASIIQSKKQSLGTLSDRVKQYQRECREIESFSRLQSEIQKVEAECAWASVSEVRKEIDGVANTRDDYQKKQDEAESKLMEAQARESTEQSTKASFDREAAEIQARLDAARIEATTCDEKTMSVARQKSEKETALRRKNEDIRQKKAEINKLEAAVREFEKQQDRLAQERSKISDALRRKQQELEDIARQLDKVRDDIRRHEENRPDVQGQEAEVRAELNRINEGIQRIRRQIDAINRDGERKEYMIHDKMPLLLHEIRKREREFQVQPLGPIGLHISLDRSEYAVAVYSCIASSIGIFVVSSFRDEQILKQIASKLRMRINTLIMDFNQTYDIPTPPTIPGCVSMMSIIKVQNMVIRNALVDVCKIDRMYICEDFGLANDLVRNRRILPEIMLRDGRKCSLKGSTFVTQPAPVQIQNAAILNDTASATRTLTEELNRLISSKSEQERRQAGLSNSYREWKTQLDASLVKQSSIVAERNRCTAKINELRAAQEEQTEAIRPEFGNRIQELEADINILQNSIQEINAEISVLTDKLSDARLERENIAKTIAFISNENIQLQKRIDDTQQRNAENSRRISRLAQDRDRYSQFVAKCAEKITELTERLRQAETSARQLSPQEIRTSQSPALLRDTIITMKRRLETECQSRVIDYDVVRKHQEAKAQYDKVKLEINKVEAFCEQQMEHLRQRTARINDFKVKNGRVSSQRFNYFLNYRGASGRLIFDHSKSELEMNVNPSAQSSGRSRNVGDQETKKMSGGERSFTTVAYLLALWECIDSPFLSMDEFDIFMDEANRKITMQLLIELARRHAQHRQYIFISPLDTSFLHNGPDISIFRLQPPRP